LGRHSYTPGCVREEESAMRRPSVLRATVPALAVLALLGTVVTPVPKPAAQTSGATVGSIRSSPVRGTPTADDAWPTFDGDPSRSGVNRRERVLGPGSVARLTVRWTRHLPGPVDSSPVYRDHRLYLTLTNGSAVAVDADSGRLLWTAGASGPHLTTSS